MLIKSPTSLRMIDGKIDEWEFVVNFCDIISAFTWKHLKVEVLVTLETDETWISDWFQTHFAK